MMHIQETAISLTLCALLASCGAPSDEVEAPPGQRSSALTATYAPTSDTWAYTGLLGSFDHGVSRELRTNNITTAVPSSRIFLRFPVQLGQICPTLGSATLVMRTAQRSGPLYVHPHRVLQPWAPGMTGLQPVDGCMAESGAAAPFVVPAVAPPRPGVLVNMPCTPYSWDVTAIVARWCAGDPNYGIMMAGRSGDGVVNFFSMESPAYQPTLIVNY